MSYGHAYPGFLNSPNGVKFIWNAAKDLPAGFKAGGIQLKVTAEK